MSDMSDLSLSAQDVRDGAGDMTPAERLERLAYERGEGALHVALEQLPVEERRQFMEADTTPVPVQYEDRKSRHASLAIVASLLGVAVTVLAWWGISEWVIR